RPDPRVLQALVLRVGPDLQLLHQEVEKLRVFAGQGGVVTEEDVEALVGESRGTTVFALCDALGRRDLPGSLRGLRTLVRLGEPAPKLLLMVVRHFRALWVGRDLLDRERRPDPRALASQMGVPPFAAEKLLDQARGWEPDELRLAFGRFADADRSLKTGGAGEVLEELVLALCSTRKTRRPGRGRGV
ncbi:MAG: DNA polymerase III subunit delta, partial [Deferrisomatales bacterium]